MANDLEKIIPAEVKNDELYGALHWLAKSLPIHTILEIGASSGDGSTEALARGAAENPHGPVLYTIEVSTPRFEKLKARYAGNAKVKPYNCSSIAIAQFPSHQEVASFYENVRSSLRIDPLEKILGWLDQDIEYIRANAIPENGIQTIKQENNITEFDLVFIDGSEFTGEAELALCGGAPAIVLDDIATFKNYRNHETMLREPAYDICIMNKFLRRGFSVFLKR